MIVARFRGEIDLMSRLYHPNVLMFIGCVLDTVSLFCCKKKKKVVISFPSHNLLLFFLHDLFRVEYGQCMPCHGVV